MHINLFIIFVKHIQQLLIILIILNVTNIVDPTKIWINRFLYRFQLLRLFLLLLLVESFWKIIDLSIKNWNVRLNLVLLSVFWKFVDWSVDGDVVDGGKSYLVTLNYLFGFLILILNLKKWNWVILDFGWFWWLKANVVLGDVKFLGFYNIPITLVCIVLWTNVDGMEFTSRLIWFKHIISEFVICGIVEAFVVVFRGFQSY